MTLQISSTSASQTHSESTQIQSTTGLSHLADIQAIYAPTQNNVFSEALHTLQAPIHALKNAPTMGAQTNVLNTSTPEVTTQDRYPRNLSEQDRETLNNFYVLMMDTETPDINALPEDQKDFYRLRFIAKKGKDLESNIPIAAKEAHASGTVYHTQEPKDAMVIRSQAARHILETRPAWNGAKNNIHQMYSNIRAQLSNQDTQPKQIHVVVQRRDPKSSDANTNHLAVGFQSVLSEQLNTLDTLHRLQQKSAGLPTPSPIQFTDDIYLPVVSRTIRSEASAVGRIVQQSHFGQSKIKPGDAVIIVDDHIQAGGAMLGAFLSMKHAGADILGVATFGAHPVNQKGLFNDDLLIELKQQLAQADPDQQIQKILESVQIPLASLTAYECLALIALVTDGNNPTAVKQFATTIANTSGTYQVVEGQHDSLLALAKKPAATPKQVVTDLQTALEAVPAGVEDLSTDRYIIYDFDNTLISETPVILKALEETLMSLGVEPQLIQEHVSESTLASNDGSKMQLVKSLPTKIKGLPELLTQRRSPQSQYTIKPTMTMLSEQLYRMFMPRYHQLSVNPSADVESKNTEQFAAATNLVQSQQKPHTMQSIVSNKPGFRLEQQLQGTALRSSISHLQGVETVSRNNTVETRLLKKPAPDMYLEQLKREAVDPQAHVIAVGDQDTDGLALDRLADYGFKNRFFVHLNSTPLTTEERQSFSPETRIYEATNLQEAQDILNTLR